MSKMFRGPLGLLLGSLFTGLTANGQSLPDLFPFPNATGVVATYNIDNGPIRACPIFWQFGTPGRDRGRKGPASSRGQPLSAAGERSGSGFRHMASTPVADQPD